MKRIAGRMDLNQKLRYIILSVMVPLAACIVLSLSLLWAYSKQYQEISHNIQVACEFDLEFKSNVDLKMYYYSVRSSYQEEFPPEEVADALRVTSLLTETTRDKDGAESIRSVAAYCHTLQQKINQMSETESYDQRQEQLEKNIYLLTKLIQEEMRRYIYYEGKYMSGLQAKMGRDILAAIVVVAASVAILVGLLLYGAFRFSNRISRSVGSLCKNVELVGNGHFDIPLIEEEDYELQRLSQGITQMAGQIGNLLEDVKREEQIQHMTQLQLLQAQVNPHFLYNTLDTIMWLVEARKTKDAVYMLNRLSVFFRIALSTGQDIIRLREEIAHTRSYMEIQQIRYRDILDYEISLPEELEELRLPKLTIQPLVENALYHGVKEKRGKSAILISCQKGEGDVLIVVEDNGIGMKPERKEELKAALESGERAGFGLAAVHERIKIYCGREFGVQIFSEYGKGTRVEVRISEEILPEP